VSALYCIAHHSYQVPAALTSAAGASAIATAIKDKTRSDKPKEFNALVLCAISTSASGLQKQLKSINTHCAIPAFLTAARYASAEQTLKQDQFAELSGQSLEWSKITTNTLPLVAKKTHADALAKVNEQGKNLITTIDDVLAQAQQLKSDRDRRLNTESLPVVTIKKHSMSASSANTLAQSISQLGDNNMHWAFAVFVGAQNELDKISEVL
jgi:hypothetical protein